MKTVLQTSGLSKNYGSIRALDNLTLSIQKGAVYGFLGPNGSGKTTSLGIIMGALHPTSGTYQWFGLPPSAESRKRVGGILEQPNFIPYLSAMQNLRLVADIKEADKSEIPMLLERVGLDKRAHNNFRTFSLGMKQRLAIAAALLGNPEVLILDEPTNGLDPQGIAEIRELIMDIAAGGTTVILASHLLEEVQKVCTHVVVLKSGKAIYAGNTSGILTDNKAIEVAAHDMQALEDALRALPGGNKMVREGKVWVVENPDMDPTALNELLHNKGVVASHLAMRSSNLEKDFLALLSSEK